MNQSLFSDGANRQSSSANGISPLMENSARHDARSDGEELNRTVSASDSTGARSLLPAAGTAARIDWIRSRLPLYLVMGSVNCRQSRQSPEHVLEQAIAGGITLFQYREKGKQALCGHEYVELARRLQHICRQHRVPFIVNDDLELALTLDADGLHVGQDDAPAESIRHRLGTDKIVGVSAHSLTEANRAIAAGADYLGIGPIYPTISKDDAEPVRGTEVIQQLRHSGLNIPLVGIGGINEHNAAPVLRDGADGVAVISAIAAADSPAQSAQLLKEQIVPYL